MSTCALVRRILSGSCGLFMTHLSPLEILQRESDTLIQASYHTQTAFVKQKRRQIHLFIKSVKYVYDLDNSPIHHKLTNDRMLSVKRIHLSRAV